MFKTLIDASIAILFLGFVYFSSSEMYKFIKKETVIQVSKGLSSHKIYTKALTKKTFDWEK